tara:strand:+ start:290 stop:688 length:399 start_codon:yes stop_codon:yes gene_type:complete
MSTIAKINWVMSNSLLAVGSSSAGVNGTVTHNMPSESCSSFDIWIDGGDLTVNLTNLDNRIYHGMVSNLDSVARTIILQLDGTPVGGFELLPAGSSPTGTTPYFTGSHTIGVMLPVNAAGGFVTVHPIGVGV